MEWTDTGLVIGGRRHGETSVILEVMTAEHGRHLGIVRGGRSKTMQPVLQPGNSISVTWRARLEDHLGMFVVEPLKSRAARIMARPFALHGVNHLSGLLHLLPERDPHTTLHAMADALAENLDDPRLAPDLLVRFELALLADFGFGLDLERCALTGVKTELAFVSPKSGRAVNRDAATPWRERLLVLPGFLSEPAGSGEIAATDIADAFRLTGHFLEREVFTPRGHQVPTARALFLADLGV